MKRLEQITSDYKNALDSLKEAVNIAESELEIDGVIQRFEFTFELFWKLLEVYLETEGIIANSPKSVLKEAFAIGLFSDEQNVLKMLDDRNETTHIYNKEKSREIFCRISEKYILLFDEILNHIILN